jgi:tellurite resistance protein
MSLVNTEAAPGLQAGPRSPRWPRVPPNFFAIPFGLAGLAEAWHAAGLTLGTSAVIPDAIDIVAAAAWAVLVTVYAARGWRGVLADLRNPVLGPFVPVSVITAMLLASALSAYSLGAARILVVAFLIITIGVGGWLTGQWIVSDLDPGKFHPGYFLPTVAGGLVGAFCAAQVHLHAVAEASFGIGILCWLLLGSILLNRLFFRPALPPALVPALAIELAPPAVAGIAYFALGGRPGSPVACVLGGYAVLMALVQLRFLPLYARLTFSPGFWAFTFSYAAAATDGLAWISQAKPAGAAAYAVVIIAAITLLIGAIAVRTVILLARGELLPRPRAA